MIHLTMNDPDRTVVSVPVKSLSRWHKANKSIVHFVGLPAMATTEPTWLPANSVVHLKDGATLYVLEFPSQIDTLYKAACGGGIEPLMKTEGEVFPGAGNLLTWTQIIDAIREADTCDKEGKHLFLDESLIRIRLGFA